MSIVYPPEGKQDIAYHTVYVIQDNLNNMIYVGAHSTFDIFDSYMGSGTYLKRAQQKYGEEHFSKHTLAFFNTAEEMFAAEELIVNIKFLKRTDVYNIKIGGSVPRSPFGIKIPLETREKISRTHRALWRSEKAAEMSKAISERQKGPKHHFFGRNLTPEHRKKLSEAITGERNHNYGRDFSPEHRKKISDARKATKGKYLWITDGNKNTKIKKEVFIPIGWTRGRSDMRNVIWATNGIKNKLLSSKEAIPDGWRRGITKKG